MREIPYRNANEDFRTGGWPVCPRSASAGAVFALDCELQPERVLQRDLGGADEARVAVGGAEVRDVERSRRLAPAKGLRRSDGAVAHDLHASAHALPLWARHGRGQRDVTAGAEQPERDTLASARRERSDAVDDERCVRRG